MSAESNKAVKQDENQNSKKAIDTSRRSFAKAGVVAPIILSFASRPSWGQEPICTPSIANSAFHQSHHPDEGGPDCTPNSPATVSPGVFQGKPTGWDDYEVGGFQGDGITFSATFGSSPTVQLGTKQGSTFSVTDSNPCLYDVISAGSNDILITADSETVLINGQPAPSGDNSVTNHYICAYLSAMSPKLFFPFTASQIVNDWGKWQLFDILQNLQKKHLTIVEAGAMLKTFNVV